MSAAFNLPPHNELADNIGNLKKWRIFIWTVGAVIVVIGIATAFLVRPEDEFAFLRPLHPIEVDLQHNNIPMMPASSHRLRFTTPAEQVGALMGIKADSIRFLRDRKDRIPAIIGMLLPNGKTMFIHISRIGEADFTCEVWIPEKETWLSSAWKRVKLRLGLK